MHLDLEAAVHGDACGPKSEIRISMRQPEHVLPRMEQYRIANDRPVLIASERVLAIAGLAPREITRRQVLGERQRIGTAYLGLALRAHVPERHALGECGVLLRRRVLE